MTLLLSLFYSAALAAVSLLASSPVLAGNWIPIGPPGGDVRALAASPSHPDQIYLGTSDGILYRSDDGGRAWRRMNPGFPRRGCSLDELVVDNRGTLFVGFREVNGNGGGLASSRDGGKTFTLVEELAGESVRAVTLAPSDHRILAAGTLTGVLLSRNGGRHWKRITPRNDPQLRNLESLAFDPYDPQVIYAGTWHLGWKTFDAGERWLPVHDGMIEDSHVMTLGVDSDGPGLVYATACTGIYRSPDGGRQWTKLSGIPESSRRTRAFRFGDQGKLLIAGTTEGVWLSRNAGESWKQVTSPNLVVNALLLGEDQRTILLGADGAGVLRSDDAGRTWTASNAGFSERFVSEIIFDTEASRMLVAVYGDPFQGGVFVCDSQKNSWIRLAKGLEGRQVLSLGLMGRTILAGTDNGIYMRPFRSGSWTRLKTVVDGRDIHPRVTELVVLGSQNVMAATGKGLLSSTDAGRSWTRLSLGMSDEVLGLAVSSSNDDLMMAVTGGGFFSSTDGGVTWSQTASSLPGVTPHGIAYVPGEDKILFATTSGGLFRSDNGGVSWRRLGGGIPHTDITGIAIHPGGRIVYASDFTWGGIFRSQDGGQNWERMPTDGLGSDRIWTLQLDPGSPDRLLAASPGGLHLYVSEPEDVGSAGSR